MKKNLMKLLAVVISIFVIITSIPIGVFAANNFGISEKVIVSERVNSEIIQLKTELLAKDELSVSDFEGIEQYAKISKENIDENLEFITVSPYEPAKILIYEDGTVVESHTTIGFVLEKEPVMAPTTAGTVIEYPNNSIIYMKMELQYDKLKSNSYETLIKLTTGYATITNLDSQCTLTKLNMKIRTKGNYVINPPNGSEIDAEDKTNSRNITPPVKGTRYSLASPSSNYYIVSFFVVLYFSATYSYTRGTSSYTGTFELMPWQ